MTARVVVKGRSASKSGPGNNGSNGTPRSTPPGMNGHGSANLKGGFARKSDRPAPRPRAGRHPWLDIDDLHFDLIDALFGENDHARAHRIADRLDALLSDHDDQQESILGQECRSLIAETREQTELAIRHRRNEIRLILRLRQHANRAPVGDRSAALDRYQPSDLADRYDILAMLHHDAGQLRKAVRALWKSRELCEEHGLKFAGAALLKDYLKELRAAAR